MAAKETITEKYRTVFGTPTGQEVLADILGGMGYFTPEEDLPGAHALRNEAKQIIEKCGIGLMTGRNRNRFVEQLFELPYENKEQESINGNE